MQAPPYTLTNESITVVWDGKPRTVKVGTPNFAGLKKAILEDRWDDIPNYLTLDKGLQAWAKGNFTVEGNNFLYKGQSLPADLNTRILQMVTRDEDPTKFFLFWERLQQNPSYRSVEQLWRFLSQKGIPFTKDGCFLAYKSVRSNYLDHHSGEYDNTPGRINRMDRNKVSDDPQTPCHEGFHVGALEYARTFGGSPSIIVVCKVNPKDVVCVPYDSSSQKMRVCEYKVVGIHNGQFLPDTSFDEDLPPVTEKVTVAEEKAPGPVQDKENPEDPYFSSDPDDQGGPRGSSVGDGDCPVADDQSQVAEVSDRPARKKKWDEAALGFFSKAELTKLHNMGTVELMEESIETLRKYATYALKIVGASKISGGKVSLVSKIIEVRG